MCERFGEGQTNQYLEWIHDHPSGYVWNVRKSKLHRVDCRFVPTGRRTGRLDEQAGDTKARVSDVAPKLCALTKEEIMAKAPAAALEKNRCSICCP